MRIFKSISLKMRASKTSIFKNKEMEEKCKTEKYINTFIK